MVEGGGLENRCAGCPRTVGSNPTPSAKELQITDFRFSQVACNEAILYWILLDTLQGR